MSSTEFTPDVPIAPAVPAAPHPTRNIVVHQSTLPAPPAPAASTAATPVRATTQEGVAAPVLPASEVVPAAARATNRKRLSDQELAKRYDSILRAFAEFKVAVTKPSNTEAFREGPATVEYAVTPAYGVAVNRIEAQLDNLKLRMRLPGTAVLGCSTHLGNVVITVPKDDSERYFVSTSEIWERWIRPVRGFAVPIGEDMVGDVVSIEFSNSNSPHFLIAGATGGGKSEALLTVLHGATKYYGAAELRLKLIDPKGTELESLKASPHVDGEIGWSAQHAIEALEEAVKEMEKRYAMFSAAKARDIDEFNQKSGQKIPRKLIVLDEYADLVSDEDEKKQIERLLKRISQKARAAGIHLIVSTQKPVVEVVNTVVKSNLPGRIALRVSQGSDSKVVLDEPGAEELTGKGDSIMKVGNKKLRLQFARHAI